MIARAWFSSRAQQALAACAIALAWALPVSAETPPQRIAIDGAVIQLTLDGDFADATARVRAWVERSAHIVSGYYGRFPVPELALLVSSTDGARVGGGTTFGEPKALIRVRVGRDVSDATLLDDWVLVHEMTHLALPDVGREHAWLSEGLATYVEGIARAQAGNRAVTDVWAEAVRSMPRGLPQDGDAGLDRTHTWGRTYWGGALFCLLADVDIRRQTGNRLGLQDALRAILRASGGLTEEWPVERIFATGDAAVGTPVLSKLYARMKDRPEATDLPALWRDLGVEPDGATVRLRADAPLAPIREAIVRPRTQ
jgi:hypothetical protein